jgi:hypothetical protein
MAITRPPPADERLVAGPSRPSPGPGSFANLLASLRKLLYTQ